jgi:RimJ/RimL family protein N-acetyltransferase
LSLCCWEEDDWLEFRHIAADPEVIRYIGDGTPWPDERSQRFVERQMTHYRERGFCLWKLTPEAGGPLIGFCGLQPLPETQAIEIGWWLARAWWGRGLATEAARVALRDGFERVGLERIVAIAQPANTASIHIMQKLEMSFERKTESRGIPVVMYSRAGPRPGVFSMTGIQGVKVPHGP